MPLAQAQIEVHNVTGPGPSTFNQGHYIILPPNNRSGGAMHQFKQGEIISIDATPETIEYLRTPVANSEAVIAKDDFGRFVATGPIASLEPDFNGSSDATGNVTFNYWILHDPAVDPLVTPAFEISSDGGASWVNIDGDVTPAPAGVAPTLFRPDTLNVVVWDSTTQSNGSGFLLRMTTTPGGSPDVRGPFEIRN